MSENSEFLYHYTNATGLIGIINGKKLWATSILHMNDAREDIHGASVVSEFLLKRSQSKSGIEADSLRKFAQQFSDGIGGRFTFSFSLSSDPDSLSQWRGYTPNGGYCIGFRKTALEKVAHRNGFQLRRCEYTKEVQLTEVANVLTPYLENISQWEISDLDARQRCSYIGELTETIRCCLKHDSFSIEKEWRIFGHVNALDPKCKWRANGPYVKPYVELPIDLPGDETLIGQIWIGPGLDYSRSREAIVHLQIGNSLKGIEILPSSSSYRQY